MINIDLFIRGIAILDCSRFKSPASDTPVEMRQEYHQILVVTAGELWFEARGERFHAAAGDVVWHPADLPYREWTTAQAPAESVVILFRLERFVAEPPPVIADTSGLIRQLTMRLYAVWLKDAYVQYGIASCLLTGILGEYLERAREYRPEMVRRLHEYVARNMARPLRLADLAAEFGYNREYLVRKYKRLAGCGPMEAVRRIRLQRAKELGMTTSLPVKHIATRVGIPDPAHFSRLFRKQFGLSMRQLRAH